jgi:hypothetical protein
MTQQQREPLREQFEKEYFSQGLNLREELSYVEEQNLYIKWLEARLSTPEQHEPSVGRCKCGICKSLITDLICHACEIEIGVNQVTPSPEKTAEEVLAESLADFQFFKRHYPETTKVILQAMELYRQSGNVPTDTEICLKAHLYAQQIWNTKHNAMLDIELQLQIIFTELLDWMRSKLTK